MEDTITISKKEYNLLIENYLLLSCLQEFGVDNWEGYSKVVEEYRNRSKIIEN